MFSIYMAHLWRRLPLESGLLKMRLLTPGEFDIICLNVFMGSYPVKCYLLICRETRATAIVDTGANPDVIIKKTRRIGC